MSRRVSRSNKDRVGANNLATRCSSDKLARNVNTRTIGHRPVICPAHIYSKRLLAHFLDYHLDSFNRNRCGQAHQQ